MSGELLPLLAYFIYRLISLQQDSNRGTLHCDSKHCRENGCQCMNTYPDNVRSVFLMKEAKQFDKLFTLFR